MSEPMNVQPVTLTGQIIRLEPLCEAHLVGLSRVAFEPEIWRYMLYGDIATEADLLGWIRLMLDRQSRGTDLPFAVVMQSDGQPVGCTRYMNIVPNDFNLEIGGTWYGKAYWRTGVNTEAKYLMLQHAFEILGAIRVQLKTDLINERSQRAIERLGAVKEGVLRNHMILRDGRVRHSVIYSIVDKEWLVVKERLEKYMQHSSEPAS